MTIKDVDCEFKNAQDFYGVYQTLPSWQKNLLCELYIHNFKISQEIEWNPLLYIGDVHLRALMSWMSNETNYDSQMDAYRELERSEPLPLRAESSKPDDLLRDWFRLTYGGLKLKIREKVFSEREKVYKEYEALPNFAQQRALVGLRNHWSRLPEAFRKAEPHNPLNYDTVINRVPKYMQLGRQVRKELWLSLAFQPPTLLWPIYVNNAAKLDSLVEGHLGEHWRCTGGFYYNFRSGKKGKTIVGDFRTTAKKYNA